MILFFLSEQKKIIYNKSDLLPIYIYKKETWENSCYFNKKLPNKDNNSNKKIENNKVDKKK